MPTAVIPVPTGFEEIEVVTIIDILRRGEVGITVAGLDNITVTGSHHITLQTDVLLDQVLDSPFDLVVLAGGPGTKTLQTDNRVRSLLQRQAEGQRWIGAICAAPIVLAQAGLLEGKNVAAHPTVHDHLGGALIRSAPVVVDGKIVTGSGPGAAMDFALQLVSLLRGTAIAQSLAQSMLVPF
ncbi:MAG: DJ-1/PfpI family protein [Oscillatoriales cyanobacterium SM2_2_1]|nr:DJ-1/PfpI family protein [Oscillatoriales cyanobacterium SM2_2_1]